MALSVGTRRIGIGWLSNRWRRYDFVFVFGERSTVRWGGR